MLLYEDSVKRYKAVAGQKAYEKKRTACCRIYDRLKKDKFIQYVKKQIHENKWSFDACVGYALKEGVFTREQIEGA